MKDWKALVRRWLFLPLWLIILLSVGSAAALVTVFVKGLEMSPVAYAVYVISSYALVTLCLACYKTIPDRYHSMKKKVYANQYANRYLTDPVYKNHVKLYMSLAGNLVYVAVNGISAAVYHTNWFGIFAVYYGIMAMLRFLLLRYEGRTQIGESRLGELKRSRLCAYILTTVNLALSGAVLMMVLFGRGFHYQGILIYVMAMYTFFVTTTAIVEMVKYRKYKSPVMSISKIIRLASALFSMLFLETAMLSQFGAKTPPMTKKILIMATGGGISVVVVTTAIYMIVRTTQEIREYKRKIKE